MMLMINNAPSGAIMETNYWQSEYNQRGLAYLSVNKSVIRLLLPTVHITAWLPEIKTGKQAIIEPAVRSGYQHTHLDIVFDDGTQNPFSLCIDKAQQIDCKLHDGDTRLIIYIGSLDNSIELPCTVKLGNKLDKPKYLTHVTINTGNFMHAYKPSAEIINHLQDWLRDMERGVSVAVTKPYLACRITHQNGKSIGFMLSFVDDDMVHTDIVEMVVCRHSRYRDKAWQSIGGGNKPAPSLPFLAVRLLVSEQEMLRLGLNIDDILMLGSFEQSIAWTWLASKE